MICPWAWRTGCSSTKDRWPWVPCEILCGAGYHSRSFVQLATLVSPKASNSQGWRGWIWRVSPDSLVLPWSFFSASLSWRFLQQETQTRLGRKTDALLGPPTSANQLYKYVRRSTRVFSLATLFRELLLPNSIIYIYIYLKIPYHIILLSE